MVDIPTAHFRWHLKSSYDDMICSCCFKNEHEKKISNVEDPTHQISTTTSTSTSTTTIAAARRTRFIYTKQHIPTLCWWIVVIQTYDTWAVEGEYQAIAGSSMRRFALIARLGVNIPVLPNGELYIPGISGCRSPYFFHQHMTHLMLSSKRVLDCRTTFKIAYVPGK